MKRNKLAIWLSLFLAIAALGLFILRPAFRNVPGYLSYTDSVRADILVVEGWLPHFALEKAYREYQENNYRYVVTTGVRYTPEYYKISDNGFLIFYTGDILKGNNESSWHTIGVAAFSDLGDENRAHFKLYINDSICGEFTAERRKRLFTVNWFGNLNDIDSIMVNYDNDVYEPPLDRNLSVKEIIVDKKIPIPYLFHSDYDMLKLDGKLRFRNNLTTTAQMARSKLISLGVDSARIIAVSSARTGINRTLTSALAFRAWLKEGKIHPAGINIISLGIHARRTWMTYNKVLHEKYKTGIISVPDREGNIPPVKRYLKTLREALGIIYYWFILLPY